MTAVFGIDVGGTFTDLVGYDGEGSAYAIKAPTTPSELEAGALNAIETAFPLELIQSAAFFMHATTAGLNAVLERRGARVGLLTTEGFRDILEIRRGERERMYDMMWKPPDPLVPRLLRQPVSERIGSDGRVLRPLAADDVQRAAAMFEEEEVEAIAVVLLHSYANPRHEQEVAELLRRDHREWPVSLSHAVSGEYREYERTATTVLDAYIRPIISSYLGRLGCGLSSLGFTGESYVTRSGGGALTFAEATARPFETVNSGPVAGAVAAGEVCRRHGLDQAVTADIDGTSFDTCLVVDGRPTLKYEGEVDGHPLQTTWVDVRSIGAGGGSIAWIDDTGLLQVGPESAGSQPGPACYGKGGARPTVTDACAVLGMLGPGKLGGGVTIDKDAAGRAISGVAAALGLSVAEAAAGIVTVATTSMAEAIRSVTLEAGYDPREMSLIAFGGAGPLFGGLLAHELGCHSVIVPQLAGNLSAWGLLQQDVQRSRAQTLIRPLDQHALEEVGATVRRLIHRLDTGEDENSSRVPDTYSAALDLRYAGQEHTVTVGAPLNGTGIASDTGSLTRAFSTIYEQRYGHTLRQPVELVTVRTTATRGLPRLVPVEPGSDGLPVRLGEGQAHSFAESESVTFPYLSFGELSPGEPVGGPALLIDPLTTVYVDTHFVAVRQASGAVKLTPLEGKS